MPSTQTVRREPPIRFSNLTKPMEYWERETQQAQPLVEIDTSKGPEEYALPAAGLDATTGQTNQNQELVIVKTSADANAVNIKGGANGPVVLTTNVGSTSVARFKSNGALWRPLQ